MIPYSKSKSFRILLVEDNDHDVTAFRWSFKKRQAKNEITHYVRAEEALERLAADSSPFDLVVIDYKLPGMSGLDLCKELLDRKVSYPSCY